MDIFDFDSRSKLQAAYSESHSESHLKSNYKSQSKIHVNIPLMVEESVTQSGIEQDQKV